MKMFALINFAAYRQAESRGRITRITQSTMIVVKNDRCQKYGIVPIHPHFMSNIERSFVMLLLNKSYCHYTSKECGFISLIFSKFKSLAS